MCQFVARRIDTATTVTRTGLELLRFDAGVGLDSADQRHLLNRLYEPENGHKALLPLLAEVITAVRDTVREWHPNPEDAIETLDKAATQVTDVAGLIATAHTLLTPPAKR
ncbi:hypothetical protein AB0K23_06380 [Streptomyces sp. NPDC049602]|uniref:hypothetical protein n=1 Tax=Streptomyces sp. NPDC049602 TaxID=3155504 RepID=UPI0034458168